MHTKSLRKPKARVFLVLALFISANAWGQTDHRAKQIEAAKKEGKLIWYTSANVTESKPLLDDFEKQYPFVKGEIFRASGEKTLNRIMTETRAGRWDVDVIPINEVHELMDAKLLAPYKSPEAKNLIADFKVPLATGAPFTWSTGPSAIILNSSPRRMPRRAAQVHRRESTHRADRSHPAAGKPEKAKALPC